MDKGQLIELKWTFFKLGDQMNLRNHNNFLVT
jgi:hypothetical protein